MIPPSAMFHDRPSSEDHSGTDLEATSDAIDEVNILKSRAEEILKRATMITPPSPPLSASPQLSETSSPTGDDIPRGFAHELSEPMLAFGSNPQFDTAKDKSTFRQYESACDRVKSFYVEQHAKQTVSYNLLARQRFHSASRHRPLLSVWEAMEKLNTMIDESDPDTQLSQIQHLLQSAEAIRHDGKPRWMQLTGLIHDLGKLMHFFNGAQGQWDVVGDTFPVGCRFSDKCIYPDTFGANPDAQHMVYGSRCGIYEEGCGMENLIMSWGHDEYLYLVVRDQSTLPREALAMIRFHSFYPWHKEGAYMEFMAPGGKDDEILAAVRTFNPYDLYSKNDQVPDLEGLKPYYLELIDEFFPTKKIKW